MGFIRLCGAEQLDQLFDSCVATRASTCGVDQHQIDVAAEDVGQPVLEPDELEERHPGGRVDPETAVFRQRKLQPRQGGIERFVGPRHLESAMRGREFGRRAPLSHRRHERISESSAGILPPAGDPSEMEVDRADHITDIPLSGPPPDAFTGEVLIVTGDDITTDDIVPATAEMLSNWANIDAVASFVFDRVDSRRKGGQRPSGDRADQLAVWGTAGPADRGSAALLRDRHPDKRETAKKLEQELLG